VSRSPLSLELRLEVSLGVIGLALENAGVRSGHIERKGRLYFRRLLCFWDG